MRPLLLALLLYGCTCGSPAAEPVAPPTAPTEAPTAPTPAPAPRVDPPAPVAPSAAETRAWLARLREARRLAHAGQPAEAYAIFEALVAERPGARQLRCEAGYVAFHAERLDDAERQITGALGGWPSPPPTRERLALAMCLYNRGLIAEARGDHVAAAEAWRRSLELRPSRTVSERLAALAVPEPTEEDETDEDDPYADGVYTYDEWLADTTAEMESPRTQIEHRIPGPTPDLGLVVVRVTTPEGADHFEEVELDLVLTTATDTILLTSVSYEVMYSWYDDHASLGQATFVAGPPELGQLVTVITEQWSRHDSDDGYGDASSAESTLTICAERRDWACARVTIASTTQRDCSSGGCSDGDEEEQEEDLEDGEGEEEGEPDPYVRGYRLMWSIDGGALVLTPDPSFEPTAPEDPPRRGRAPLVELFAAP